MTLSTNNRTVAIGGLGAIGLTVARALDDEPGDLSLIAVAASSRSNAQQKIAGFRDPPAVVEVAELAQAQIVVEAANIDAFDDIVVPAVERGRIVVTASVGAWLSRPLLIQRARETGATIIVPTGAIAGLDAVRAAALGNLQRVSIETRKAPTSLINAPYVNRHGIELNALTRATRVFVGNAAEAAAGFPSNANVAAALALAGIGPERTEVEIWADPAVTRNVHIVRVESDSLRGEFTIEALPSIDNPRTSRLASLSMLACLRGLTASFKVGS